MTIKKSTATLKKAELFEQLALRSLAQSAGLAGDPLNGQVGTQYVDPSGKLRDERSPEQVAAEVQKNFPYLNQGKPATTHPNTQKPTGPSPAPVLPAGAAAELAQWKGKNLLNVTLYGKNLSVKYNAARMTDTGMKARLEKAMPGYTVNVIGETNSTTIPNY